MQAQPVDILLVDDSDDDVLLIREAFDEARCTNIVHVARDGEEALAFLRREGDFRDAGRPGLVLLDINMPKKSGLEVLADIKADERLASTPVVMLTTSDREEDILRSYAGGASSYVRKPVAFEDLMEVVRHFSLYWVLVSSLPQPR